MRLADRLTTRLRGSPLMGVTAVAAVVLIMGGLLVWLFVSHGDSDGPAASSDVLAESVSPTPRATPTRLSTTTPTATAVPPSDAAMEAAGTPASGGAHESAGPAAATGMRMVIPSIGVDAPVNVRTIGSDGVMEAPNGRFDVIWYDFSAFAGMGGYPGHNGNAVFSGHVDYHPHYTAVFWDLRQSAPGDIIEVYLPNGSVARYTVQWNEVIDPESDFSSYCRDTGEAIITIVTCQGTFSSATGQLRPAAGRPRRTHPLGPARTAY